MKKKTSSINVKCSTAYTTPTHQPREMAQNLLYCLLEGGLHSSMIYNCFIGFFFVCLFLLCHHIQAHRDTMLLVHTQGFFPHIVFTVQLFLREQENCWQVGPHCFFKHCFFNKSQLEWQKWLLIFPKEQWKTKCECANRTVILNWNRCASRHSRRYQLTFLLPINKQPSKPSAITTCETFRSFLLSMHINQIIKGPQFYPSLDKRLITSGYIL